VRVNSREKLVRVSYRLAARYFSREFLRPALLLIASQYQDQDCINAVLGALETESEVSRTTSLHTNLNNLLLMVNEIFVHKESPYGAVSCVIK